MRRFRVLLKKELLDLGRQRLVLLTVLLSPLVLTGVAIGSLVAMANLEVGELSAQDLALLSKTVDCAGLDGSQCIQLSFASMHRILFLLIPAILPTAVAAYAVVGEKTERTLEALLATPIRTWELLLAKAAAAVVPALVATWVGAAAHATALVLLLPEPVLWRVYDATWIGALLVTAPLVALGSVLVSIMISSRSIDPRSAQQLGGLVVIPMVGAIVSQALGFAVVTPLVLGVVTVVLAGVDLLLGWATIQLFERETILTRWTGL
jgi:ABC-2 type transport system permease protein